MSSTTTFPLEENGNAEDKYGMTAVCRAIKNGNKDLVLAYIKQGLDMNYQNEVDGVTAFIRACNTENVDMVKFLIDHVDKLNVNLTDRCGYSALHYSCQYGRKEIIRLILQRTKPVVTLYTIEKALEKIDEQILKELIDIYKAQDDYSSTLLSVLAKGPTSLSLLPYALGTKNNKTTVDDEIFLSACQTNCNIDTVNWLQNEGGEFKLQINTCVNSDGRTGLMLAVLNHAESIVELLLAHGANPYVKDYANCDSIELANKSYDDGADYLRIRDPPEVVI
jgi:ankyrin repeat protein